MDTLWSSNVIIIFIIIIPQIKVKLMTKLEFLVPFLKVCQEFKLKLGNQTEIIVFSHFLPLLRELVFFETDDFDWIKFMCFN